jgi:predicted MFS family arabinose efflux permease
MPNAFIKSIQLYKNAYSGHPKEIWAIAVMTLINRLGTMVLLFLTVYFTTVLHFPLREAGFLAGAFGVGSLAGSWLGGKLTDRIGANPVIIGSLFLGGLLIISLQCATEFASLYVLILFMALFGEAYRPAMTASIADYVPPNKSGRTMAFIRLAINLGMTASPAIGGFVAAGLGYKYLFWIDGLTCIGAAIYFWLVSRKWKKRQFTKEENAAAALLKATSLPAHKNRLYLQFLLATFLLGFCFIQWFQAVPVFIKTEWGFDERYIGMVIAGSSILIILIEMPLIDVLEKSNRIRPAVLLGLILIGLSFLPFLFPKALWLFCLGMFLLTIGEIIFLPFNTAIPLNMSPPGRRGEYMSGYWMAWSLTHVTGPTIGLAFADAFGFSAYWLLLCGLVALSWLLHVRLADRIF